VQILSSFPDAFCLMQNGLVIVFVDIAWKPSSLPVIFEMCTLFMLFYPFAKS